MSLINIATTYKGKKRNNFVMGRDEKKAEQIRNEYDYSN